MFSTFKWDKNQLDWVSVSLFIMFTSYEGHKCKIENEWDSNPKLMKCFDKLKYEVKSVYKGILMHNYMIWLVYALIVGEMNYIDDEIIMLNDNVFSCVGWFLDDDNMNMIWWGEYGDVDKMMIMDNNLSLWPSICVGRVSYDLWEGFCWNENDILGRVSSTPELCFTKETGGLA